jgi:hypothetical protein
MDYWDTSALFKPYFPETDSGWFIARFAAAREPVVTSEIAVVELYCNLLRNERMGRMAPGSAATQFRRFTEHCDTGSIVALGVDRAVVLQAQAWADRASGHSRPVLIGSLGQAGTARSASPSLRVDGPSRERQERQFQSSVGEKLQPWDPLEMAQIAGPQRQIMLQSGSRNPDIVVADQYAVIAELTGNARSSPCDTLIWKQKCEVAQEAQALFLTV